MSLKKLERWQKYLPYLRQSGLFGYVLVEKWAQSQKSLEIFTSGFQLLLCRHDTKLCMSSPSKMIASENCKIPSTMFNGAVCSVSLVRNDLKNDGVDWNDGWSYFLLRSFAQALKEHSTIWKEGMDKRIVITFSKGFNSFSTFFICLKRPFMVNKTCLYYWLDKW